MTGCKARQSPHMETPARPRRSPLSTPRAGLYNDFCTTSKHAAEAGGFCMGAVQLDYHSGYVAEATDANIFS